MRSKFPLIVKGLLSLLLSALLYPTKSTAQDVSCINYWINPDTGETQCLDLSEGVQLLSPSASVTDSPAGSGLLLSGINRLGLPEGVPGPLVVDSNWTPIALTPSYTLQGQERRPGILAAARTFGDGQIFAIGHGGYLGSDPPGTDNAQFGQNIMKWLTTSGTNICVRQTQWSEAIEERLVNPLPQPEYQVQRVGHDQPLTSVFLANCDVLVYSTRWDPIENTEVRAVVNFVESGGSVLLTGLGWSYAAYVDENVSTFPMNQIGQDFGVRFEDGELLDQDLNYEGDARKPQIYTFFPEVF